ncbi:MAG: hypothetical protein NVSMB19_09510 [Vulcanimicrobiaceae bacterium]
MDDAFYVAAARVSLVSIPTAVLASRVRSAPAELVAATRLDAAGAERDVVYPATWPGDARKLFAGLLARREAGEADAGFVGAIVDRRRGVAVGNMGTHGPPAGGRVEIGYGIEPAYAGCGYATEMLRAFAGWLCARHDVDEVVAETLAANVASMRVLEKSGFARVGMRRDADGPLVRWARLCDA